MKKIFIIAILTLVFNSLMFSQQDEKIETAKKELITKELELTSQEADAFFPIYNEYNQKKREIKRSFRKDMNSSNDQNLDRIIGVEQGMVDLQKEYTNKFRKVISDKKIIKLYEVEREFKKYLIKKLND